MLDVDVTLVVPLPKDGGWETNGYQTLQFDQNSLIFVFVYIIWLQASICNRWGLHSHSVDLRSVCVYVCVGRL